MRALLLVMVALTAALATELPDKYQAADLNHLEWARFFSPCSDVCVWAGDGQCDDGGPSASSNACKLGSDCADCGGRAPHEIPRAGPSSDDQGGCHDSCRFSGDEACDDGGPGAAFAECGLGTDCADCGQRASADMVEGTADYVNVPACGCDFRGCEHNGHGEPWCWLEHMRCRLRDGTINSNAHRFRMCAELERGACQCPWRWPPEPPAHPPPPPEPAPPPRSHRTPPPPSTTAVGGSDDDDTDGEESGDAHDDSVVVEGWHLEEGACGRVFSGSLIDIRSMVEPPQGCEALHTATECGEDRRDHSGWRFWDSEAGAPCSWLRRPYVARHGLLAELPAGTDFAAAFELADELPDYSYGSPQGLPTIGCFAHPICRVTDAPPPPHPHPPPQQASLPASVLASRPRSEGSQADPLPSVLGIASLTVAFGLCSIAVAFMIANQCGTCTKTRRALIEDDAHA